MDLISKKNFLLILAAGLVVALAIMAMSTRRTVTETASNYDTELTNIQTQSESDELEEIEADLNDTDFESIDNELDSLERELN